MIDPSVVEAYNARQTVDLNNIKKMTPGEQDRVYIRALMGELYQLLRWLIAKPDRIVRLHLRRVRQYRSNTGFTETRGRRAIGLGERACERLQIRITDLHSNFFHRRGCVQQQSCCFLHAQTLQRRNHAFAVYALINAMPVIRRHTCQIRQRLQIQRLFQMRMQILCDAD